MSQYKASSKISSVIRNAFNKYGYTSFEIHILEEGVLKDSLTAREQYYLDTLQPFKERGYNVATIAESCLGIKRSEETKEKIRQSKLGKSLSAKHIEKMRQSSTGKLHTEESKKKMSEVLKGKKQSPEQIEKLAQTRRGRPHKPEHKEKIKATRDKKKVVQISLDGIEIKIYSSIAEAATKVGVHQSSISAVCRQVKGIPTVKGYK